MWHVSPERIGSAVMIKDDGSKYEDICEFRADDIFYIVDDLDEIDEFPVVDAKDLLNMIKRGETIEFDRIVIENCLDIRDIDLAKDEQGFLEINSSIKITNSFIKGSVYLTKAKFKNPVNFAGSQFGSHAYFYESKLDSSVFQGSIFNGVANFRGSEFIYNAYFNYSIFYKDANFYMSKFNGIAAFTKSEFWGDMNFNGSIFKGDMLSFLGARFNDPANQENACRKAKMLSEKNGDRALSSYYFYREMEAIRKKRGVLNQPYILPYERDRSLRAETWLMIKQFFWYDFVEYIFVQGMFGYGVHPMRLMISWGAIVILFSILYLIGNGLKGDLQPFDYLKFSLATAIAPGYIATIISPESTGYKLDQGYQAVAIVESILGTFLWAGFIATFAKKYMK